MRLKAIILCFNFVLPLLFLFVLSPLPQFLEPELLSITSLEQPQAVAVVSESNIGSVKKVPAVKLAEKETTLVAQTHNTVRIKIVANNITWLSLDKQMADLENWFWEISDQKLKLQTQVVHTNFTNIPFVAYNYDLDPNLEGIDVTWYDQNVTPLAEQADMVLFLLNTNDWTKTAVKGWTLQDNKKLVRIQVGVSEDEESYNPEDPFTPVSAFVDYSRHEITHALFLLANQEDVTHKYWFEGRFSEIFNEIDYSQL